MKHVVWAALLMINTLNTPYASLELNMDENQKKVGFVHGDFIIGALFSIRENSEVSIGQLVKCGKIRDQYGMQRVEAALWTINKINSERKILPNNHTLGIYIRDTCWNPRLALHQSLQFIDFCPTKSEYKINETSIKSIIGVIGPPSSDETERVQRLLQIFGLPQVGFSATSAKFSEENNTFDFFARVVPSDKYQVLAMIQILKKFNWTYVNAVGSEGVYGKTGLKEFMRQAPTHGICIHKYERIRNIKLVDADFDNILEKFGQFNSSKVIICFCEGETVRSLLLAAKRANKSHKFILIGSDGWAGRDEIVEGIQAEAAGHLMIRINSPPFWHFQDYYFNMSRRNDSAGNPWMEDFYEEKFNCTFDKNQRSRQCSGNEWNSSNYAEDPKLSFVVKSIYVFAHAMGKFLTDVCLKNETASCMDWMNTNRSLFMNEYIKKVNFTFQNETINFNKDGDPLASYEIINYQYFEEKYQYRPVGSWSNDTFILHVDKIRLPGNVSSIKSVCSEPCRPGQRKEIQEQICCWICKDCEKNEYSDGVNCTACTNDSMPYDNKTDCFRKVTEHTVWWKTEILICLTMSAIGISLSVTSAAVFYKFRKTPVVKFSSKELSFIMYSGMILAYGSTYFILATPNKLNCILVRFTPGVSLTMIYGPLVLKTNRVSRIFSMSKKRFPKLRPKYLSTKFQILASIVFILVELSICAIYMKYNEPGMTEKVLEYSIKLECLSTSNDIICANLLNVILLAFCTLYAFKTRNLPDNFNESKFIAFSCYATVITWSAFLLIYCGSSLKLISLSLVLTTSSLIVQMCLFVPKLYIILLRPEKNQRAYFITTKGIRTHVGSVDSTFVSEHFIKRRKKDEVESSSSTDVKDSKRILQNGNSE